MNKLFGNLGLGSTCNIQLTFDGNPPTTQIRGRRGAIDTVPVFSNKETISGKIALAPVPGKRFEFQGVRVQLVGDVELASERGHPHEFLSLVRELAPAGELVSQQTFSFEFKTVEMEHESYRGMAVRLSYKLRVVITRGFGSSIVRDYPIWVRNPTPSDQLPDVASLNAPIKMEVGIEDCLHIEFEYNKGSYHLTDTVLGKIYFLLVRIKLKHMELELRRRETTGAGPSARVETETLAKFEVMDGAPSRGEVIPIRMHLAPYELTPSYPNVHNKFSVKHLLNLVLVDEEDRRYFKQQEIRLYRVPEDDANEGDQPSGTDASGNGPRDGSNRALTPRTAGRILSGTTDGSLQTPPETARNLESQQKEMAANGKEESSSSKSHEPDRNETTTMKFPPL